MQLRAAGISRVQRCSDVDIKGIGHTCRGNGHQIRSVGPSRGGDNLLSSDVPCSIAQQVSPRSPKVVMLVLPRALAAGVDVVPVWVKDSIARCREGLTTVQTARIGAQERKMQVGCHPEAKRARRQ